MASVATFAEWRDRIVAAIEGLRKMRGGRGIRVDWKGGVPVVVCTLGRSGGAGGDGVFFAKTTARAGARTYTVDVYSGFAADFSLPTAKRVEQDATMICPFLNDTATADQLAVGISFPVVKKSFTEDDGEGGTVEVEYWVPTERVGLP